MTMDVLRRSGGAALPVEPPDPPFAGADPTGSVRIRIDRSGRDVRIGLDRRWRTAVGTDRLGAAVLAALDAAALDRLASWEIGSVAQEPATASGNTGSADRLRRAGQDLREFRVRLAELQRTTSAVPGPGRRLTAAVRGGRIVGLDLDPAWRRTAPDAELEHHLEQALRAGLRHAAAQPERALDGCPDLVAVLAGAPADRWGGPR
jgi:hypothetical protein